MEVIRDLRRVAPVFEIRDVCPGSPRYGRAGSTKQAAKMLRRIAKKHGIRQDLLKVVRLQP